ncbi:hypothetical protein RMATCC62417_04876 [Rhizopus microsporus]|nr:hypothetical protein RMATCC62417_04876 [Rhizopus microsporus]
MVSFTHVNYFVEGIKEAFNWSRVIRLISLSKQTQYTLIKSFALNGVIYLGTLVLLETFYPNHHIFGYSYIDLTGYPLSLVCLVLNSRLYAKIAQFEQNTTGGSFDNNNNLSVIMLYGNMALFTLLLKMIPVVGSVLAFIIYCIVMSYYCFEYKWMKHDWSIEKRLTFAEEHWSYYLGFGLPGTILTFFLSTLKASAVFALIYPTYIIMASAARPQPVQKSEMDRIPIFFGVRIMNQCITNLWLRYYRQSKSYVSLPLNTLDTIKFSKRE